MSDQAAPGLAPQPVATTSCGFLEDVVEGLRLPQKEIPCKYLYDERGSLLFERICELPEYYPTRTELGIMERSAAEMAAHLGAGCVIIEPGSGSSRKTAILLEHLEDAVAYVPVDIAREPLEAAAASLARAFPGLAVRPVCSDFTARVRLPLDDLPAHRRVLYFPGSTIGNFHPPEAVEFLQRAAELCGTGGGLLIGVDLRKDVAVLERAYDDASGVTAEFNLNLLARANRELGARFDLHRFRHRAFFHRRASRIEMHLVSTHDQAVPVGGEVFTFRAGESIRTECSYKYDPGAFGRLASLAGWRPGRIWVDAKFWFSVQYFAVPRRGDESVP